MRSSMQFLHHHIQNHHLIRDSTLECGMFKRNKPKDTPVLCYSTIDDKQMVESGQMPTTKQMGDEKMVDLQKECYFALRNDKTTQCIGKCTPLKVIMLSKTRQTQKNKHYMFSLIDGRQIKRSERGIKEWEGSSRAVRRGDFK